MKTRISYFPVGMKYIVPFLLIGAGYLAYLGFPVWTVILTITSLIILTTYYVTEIHIEEKRYDDYISILGIPVNNESNSFRTIDRIVITKGSYAQTVNTRVQSRQLDWSDYTATILFDGDLSLDLLTRTDKHELLVELKKMLTSLSIDVEDRTGRDPYFIDLGRVE